MADDNWEAQADEVVALAAIFGAESVAARVGGRGVAVDEDGAALRDARPARGCDSPALLEVCVLVTASVPAGGVPLVVCPAGEGDGRAGAADPGPPPPRVAHLPPLLLRSVLPAAYPADPGACPAGTVSAPWLPARAAKALEAGLGEAWGAVVAGAGGGAGAPVLWEWAEWAREAAVRAAVEASGPGCGDGIDLSAAAAAAADAADEGASPPALSSPPPPQPCAEEGAEDAEGAEGEERDDPLAAAAALATDLLRHAADAAAADFAARTHACPVCLDEVPGGRCVRAGSGGACDHALCAPCAAALVRAALAPGGAGARGCACPVPGCGARLDPAVFAAAGLLTAPELEAWAAADLHAALASMPDLVHCPHCSTPALADPDDHLAVCPAPTCRFAFCGLCLGAWHPAAACMGAAARLAVFKARMAGARPTGGQLAELRRREQEYLSAAAIERSGAKRCPGCGAAIQRTEGCNKMVCPACATRFCYRCGAAIEGYDHFRAGGCVLFEAAELARWERAVGGGGLLMGGGGLGGAGGVGGLGGVGVGVGGNNAAAAAAGAAGMGAAADRAEAAARNQFWAAVGADGQQAAGPPRLPRCPRCGQGNARVGRNNHLCCFACRGYFCAACGEGLPGRGGGLHYGKPPKCQQHS